jgi:hypothetical protein
MEKITKKDIANTVEAAMGSTLEKLNITSPTKKTEKVLHKVSKEFSGQLKKEVKKLDKEASKAIKKIKKTTKEG